MTARPIELSEQTRRLLREAAERPLSTEEFLRRLRLPIGDREREEAEELIRWFTRRYPSAAERLAYARQAHRRWTRAALK